VPFDRRVWMEALALRDAGYRVSVISPTGRGFDRHYEMIEGIHVYRHPMPAEESSARGYIREYLAALRWELKVARQVFREQGFDIIHICNPPDLLFLVALWFKVFHGTRVIYDQHDLVPELYLAKFGRRNLFYRMLLWAERLTFMVADTVIAPNESHRDVALTRGKKTRDEVFIVQSGPDVSRFQIVPADPTYRRGRRYLVGYVGVMGEQEGIDSWLRSMHYIVHKMGRSDIHSVLIGGGPAFNRLRMMADELAVSEYVEFAGWRQGSELIEWLSSCDICISPDPKNAYSDHCTMNKVLEYMALGKPIVQYDLLEGRRTAGDAALYAIPGSPEDFAVKVVSLLDDPVRREAMGREGRRRIMEHLEWRYQVPRLLQAYAHATG